MNRQIKFRAWDTVLNKFEAEYVVIKPNGEVCVLGMANNACIPAHEDRFVIQWFTGLHDHNGAPIYEGDILEELTHNETKTAIGVCKPLLSGWKIFSYPDSSICWHGWKHKVVGNIFENKNLLKNKYE